MVHLRTDIGATNPNAPMHPEPNSTYAKDLTCDVLIVGAGFGGVYLLHKLRDEVGLNVKIFEAANELGGVWRWNCYPGARVDTQVPVYEYSIEKVWKDWTWSQKYPDFNELRNYFHHVEETLDIKKDVSFNTRVIGSQFDQESKTWEVKTEDGRTAKCKYLINAIGFAAKRHFPDWKGLTDYKGELHHSSFWPDEGVNVKGKRVAVIGTGSTGIQIAQETAKDAASVTVFQRTPNLCLPMRQRELTKEEQQEAKSGYPEIYRKRLTTFAGFSYDYIEKNTFDDNEEEREKFFESMWEEGGFRFWLAGYKDLLFDSKANDQAYDFWVKKTRARIADPRKRDILAPLKAPHAWGTKRPSLEQNFYEMMDRAENDVVNVKETPITEFTETGIVTSDGKLREFDIIALATGFDSVTGGMKNMGLKNTEGKDLAEKWKNGTWTYLGMTCNGFPVSLSPTCLTNHTASLTNLKEHVLPLRCPRSHRLQQRSHLCRSPRRLDRRRNRHTAKARCANHRGHQGCRDRLAPARHRTQRQDFVPRHRFLVHGCQYPWQAQRTTQLPWRIPVVREGVQECA